MLRLITAPVLDVVTLAEARAQCRVDIDNTDEDTLISRYVAAAVARFDGRDGILGMALRPQTWDLIVPRFPGGFYTGVDADGAGWAASGWAWQGRIALPLPPTISVTSVKYLDETETERTLDPACYRVIDGGGAGAQIVLKTGYTWPSTVVAPDAVRVRFVCGHAAAPAVPALPEEIRQAVLLLVGEWYSNRSNAIVGTTAVELPTAAAMLIAPYRQIYEPEAVAP